MRRGARVAALAGILSLATPPLSPATAQATPKDTTVYTTRDSALEARTSAVAGQLRCPVCQGLSIQDSPSELAQSMRALVRDQLAAGKTPEQVKAYFVSKYGEWILLSPVPHGFNLLAYLFPVLVVLGGGALIVLAVRRWTSPAPESPSA
jgi:cytochrome c-type biogenesis protein CcmH